MRFSARRHGMAIMELIEEEEHCKAYRARPPTVSKIGICSSVEGNCSRDLQGRARASHSTRSAKMVLPDYAHVHPHPLKVSRGNKGR